MVKKQQKKIVENKVTDKKIIDWAIKISKTQSDAQSFLEKFKADVARKIKEYQEYAQELRKKKKH